MIDVVEAWEGMAAPVPGIGLGCPSPPPSGAVVSHWVGRALAARATAPSSWSSSPRGLWHRRGRRGRHQWLRTEACLPPSSNRVAPAESLAAARLADGPGALRVLHLQRDRDSPGPTTSS